MHRMHQIETSPTRLVQLSNDSYLVEAFTVDLIHSFDGLYKLSTYNEPNTRKYSKAENISPQFYTDAKKEPNRRT